MILTGEKRTQQQDHDGNANRGIADIEYQKWTKSPEVEVRIVHDIAEAHPIEDVAERSAKHHSKCSLVEAVLLASNPDCNAGGDDRGEPDEHPAPDRIGRVQKSERDALVLGVGEVENREEHQLVADLVDPERMGDRPFGELVEDEDDKRDGKSEPSLSHEERPRSGHRDRHPKRYPAGTANSGRICDCSSSPPSNRLDELSR